MKFLAALAIIAVAFASGYGTAHQWLVHHPKPAPAPVFDPGMLADADWPPPPPAAPEEPDAAVPAPEPETEAPMEPEVPVAVAEPVAPAPPESEPEVPPLPAIDFDSQDARVAGESAAAEEAVGITLVSGDWEGYRDHLRAALAARFAGLDLGDLRELDAAVEPVLVHRLLAQERFLTRVGDAVIRPHFAEDHAFARWLLGDTRMLEAVYHHLGAGDDAAALLVFLADLYQEMPDILANYGHLAVACSLVHDYGEGAAGEATRRFLWYVEQDRLGRLHRDIKSMPVADLVYVVGGVGLDEMTWVQDAFRRNVPRTKAGSVYGQIRYRMDLVTGDIGRNELYPEYTLAAIAENGGVCADQAHFAENVCRALGIPAVKISGSGNRGAHAWVGYQESDGRWLTFGRYEDYANGHYRDPQNRSDTIETALSVRSTAPYRSGARTERIQRRFLVADLMADTGDLRRATRAAVRIAEADREYLPAWERVFGLVEQQKEAIAAASAAPVPEPDALTAAQVVAVVRSFELALKDHPDMLDRADAVLTETLDGSLDDATLLEILHRRRRRVETYDAGRLGTILDLIRQEAAILARADDFDAVASLYRQELRQYGDNLQFFRKLASSFWDLSQDDPGRRDAALGLLNAEINSNFERLLEGRDYFGKETAIGVFDQLAGYYRQAGNDSRADQIARKLERAREELKETKT